jgi:hypothetical protein
MHSTTVACITAAQVLRLSLHINSCLSTNKSLAPLTLTLISASVCTCACACRFVVYTGLRGGWHCLPEPITPLCHPNFKGDYGAQVKALAAFDFAAAIDRDIGPLDPQLARLLSSILVPRTQVSTD